MRKKKGMSKLMSLLSNGSAITKIQAAIIVVVVVVAIAGVGIWYVAYPPVRPPVTLVFASPEWLPGSLTGSIAEGFPEYAKEKLGYEVYVEMDLVPWGTYHDKLATAFAAHSDEFDLVISDSQFVGEFATAGHIIKLNDWIKEHHPKDLDMFEFYPNLVKYYCTYPPWDFDMEKFEAGDLQLDTVNYYGLPHEADTDLLIWRTDLFRNDAERAAFKAKYGYDLPYTYEDWYDVTWQDFRDFAEFFTRKAGDTLAGEVLTEDFYGCATWNSVYDSAVYQWHAYLWAAGGDIWNWETREVMGYTNSPISLEALEWYVSLHDFEPPGSEAYWFDECNTAMAGAKVAMMTNCAGFLPPLYDPEYSKVHDKIEVTIWPGIYREDLGKVVHYSQLVGQPMCVSAYSKHQEEALLFFEFWFLDENQWKWSEGGGGVCKKSIVETDEFVKAAPWNRADRETLPIMKDFWNVPCYDEMMMTEGEYINAAYAGEIEPKEALDAIATELTSILKKAGILG